jgi:hypothetical protein
MRVRWPTENTLGAEEPVAVDDVIIFGRAAPSSFRASQLRAARSTTHKLFWSTLDALQAQLSIIYGERPTAMRDGCPVRLTW